MHSKDGSSGSRAGDMHNKQGPNIQGSQKLTDILFNYGQQPDRTPTPTLCTPNKDGSSGNRDAGDMYNEQGPNIQGSQTFDRIDFNYGQHPDRSSVPAPTTPTPTVDNQEQVAGDFVNRYYTAFRDNDLNRLADLYHPASLLTFNNGEILRGSQIIPTLTSLRQNQCPSSVTSFEHLAPKCGGILLVVVHGKLQLQAGGGPPPPPHKFTQVFHLKPKPDGDLYIAIDISGFIPALKTEDTVSMEYDE